MLPPEKMSLALKDRTRDVRVLVGASLSRKQRHLAEKLANAAAAAAAQPRKLQARGIIPMKDAPTEQLLEDLTSVIGGLDDIDEALHFNRCGSDPGVFTSRPARVTNGSGGQCNTHVDYVASNYRGCRCVSFYMLLRNVGPTDGPTYVYAGSRELEARPRAAPPLHTSPVKAKKPGRPPKRKRSEAAKPGINPAALKHDLTRLCGQPIVFEGERLTIFRSESSEWHGAKRNTSQADRSVLIWSYCSEMLVGKMDVEC